MIDEPPHGGESSGEPAEAGVKTVGREGIGHSPPRTHESFLAHLLRAIPVIVGVTVLTSALSHFGFLRPFETAAIDSYLRLKPPLRSEHVVIVGIDECDYSTLFGATSPLDVTAVAKLLGAIAAGRPRVIVVDLDTSDKRFGMLSPPANGPPVIWARGATPSGSRTDCTRATPPAPPGTGRGVLVPEVVLGGTAAPGSSGLAIFPRDPDGVVRRYYRAFETTEGSQASLPWSVVRLYRDGSGVREDKVKHEPLVLNLAGDRFAFARMSAGDVLRVAGSEGWADAGPLRGRIVLLGGFYRAARDEHMTPVGPMSGVELVAQAIESELQGGGIRPADEAMMIVLEILGGILLVWFHHRLRIGAALAASVVAIPLCSLAFSFLAFSSAALWANFVPILAAVLVHQLYDHARAYRELYVRMKSKGGGP